jgi:hypothetical protein
MAGGGGYAREDRFNTISSVDVVHLMTNNQKKEFER